MTVESAAGRVRVIPGRPAAPDLVLSGAPDGIVGLLAGKLDPDRAATRGVGIKGDTSKLAKLYPRSATEAQTSGFSGGLSKVP